MINNIFVQETAIKFCNLLSPFRLLKQSQRMKQLMPISGWRRQSNRSSTDSRRMRTKTTLHRSPSSSKFSQAGSRSHRPTLNTKIANDITTSQGMTYTELNDVHARK